MDGDAGRDNGELRGNLDCHGEHPLAGRMAALMAENRELRAELERVRSEKAKVTDVQARLMEVLGTKSPERLVHDVRNVLNERELYRALADVTGS